MDASEYVENRLDPAIQSYEQKSTFNKRWHITLRIVEIVCAAFVPLLSGYADGHRLIAIGDGALGVVIALCAGMAALLKFQEQWIKYRTTTESLKKEKYLFLTKVEPYNGPDALTVLVQRVEALIAQESNSWAQSMTKTTTEDTGS